MKFIVSSSALLKQLQGLQGVLTSSNTLPILDNFLFEIDGKKLTVTASDLETTINASMPVEAKDKGSVAIPARLLLDTLKAFPEQPLTFSVDPKHFGIEVSSDQGNYKMTGFSGSEFPKSPALEEPTTFTLPAGTLATAINKTIFATGNDDLRPVMSGIFFELSEDAVRFVATDAHKLVRYTRTDISSPAAATFIVPKKPLNLLKNSLVATNAEVTVEFNENNAAFTFDNIRLVCRLIDGKYPNYEAVIPKQNPNKLTMDRQSFLNSIRRVALFSNKTTHQVRLSIAGSQLAISAEDLDFANEANEKLTCNYEGEDMTIGFNSRFLMDMLINLDSENIVMEMSAPNRAGILLPSGGSEHGEDVLMLVMPVMLNN
ncbi:MAG: DNA polymerase III subunit beta [Flavobacteriales bacterium]|jgi:DNA polymerase-3 subunit beta|nr:DNA polymerase III subunit beta [Flavobacteriales bacterium]MBP9161433.1 DNA polymerase III subunit beta [Flavobacteriales bacterium]MCI1754225.1 DNA polymerase III subunit beta [Flavobacteriales bacterium]